MSIGTVFLVVLPVLTGALVVFGVSYYSKLKYSARNISPSYFTAVALLFALFASLVFGEVWGRISKINSLMLEQANALRGILRITENIPAASAPFMAAVKSYIDRIDSQERTTEVEDKAEPLAGHKEKFSSKLIRPFYALAADSVLFKKNEILQLAVLNKADQLRNAWFEREELLKQRILPEKMLVLFLMGFFTQVSIGFSHLGNDRAVRDTVWLFSLAFFAAMAILITIDDTEFSRQFLSFSALKDVQ